MDTDAYIYYKEHTAQRQGRAQKKDVCNGP